MSGFHRQNMTYWGSTVIFKWSMKKTKSVRFFAITTVIYTNGTICRETG